MIDELIILNKAGLSNLEALQCATLNAAKILGNPNIGTVEEGKIADLILLNGNPLENLNNLNEIHTVFFGGEQVDEKWMCNLQ